MWHARHAPVVLWHAMHSKQAAGVLGMCETGKPTQTKVGAQAVKWQAGSAMGRVQGARHRHL